MINPLRMVQRQADSVPARLTPREAVLNRNAAELMGRHRIAAFNAMGNMMARRGVDLPTQTKPGRRMIQNPLHYQYGTSDVAPTSFLGGALSGQEQAFIDAGKKYGVDPKLLMAISLFETTGGTSHMIRSMNNVAGITNPGGKTYRSFGSIPESIDYMASNLKRNYIDQGLTTIPAIGAKYAPVGAANDPNKTNAQWPGAVTKIYSQLGRTPQSTGGPQLTGPELTGLPETQYPTVPLAPTPSYTPPTSAAATGYLPGGQPYVPGGATQVPTQWTNYAGVGFVPKAIPVASSGSPELAKGIGSALGSLGKDITQMGQAQTQAALQGMAQARANVPLSNPLLEQYAADPLAPLRAAGLI
jgi:hypothetical protein